MIRLDIKSLGEMAFYINKGSIGEWEDYFKTTWIKLIVEGLTFKHWYVLIFKAYEVACYRDKKTVIYNLKDIENGIEGDDFNKLIQLIDAELENVLQLSKMSQLIEEQSKGKKKLK